MMPTNLSVVINTLNRANLLQDALHGLTALDGPAPEVVVVNGPSTDETASVLETWRGRIRVLDCPDANLSRSRNMGLSASSGDVVAFIDDDAVPHPFWLRELAKAYADPKVGAAGGFTVGRGGTTFQSRKVVCDRFGDAYYLADNAPMEDFCQPGSWLFPSLLGTNCSFRRQALLDVGGFDETFTYYLEETDLCLRLVDAGWQVRFVPNALVWHQFAQSPLRTKSMAPRSVEAILRSQSYFINRHGLGNWSPKLAREAADRLCRLQDHWRAGTQGAGTLGLIDDRHSARLAREIDRGIRQGRELAEARGSMPSGHWQGDVADRHLKIGVLDEARLRCTIAFICRQFGNGAESGIPRWTKLASQSLVERGHRVHIVAEAESGDESIRSEGGIWTHRIACSSPNHGWVSERYGLPADQAQWAASVREYLPFLRAFGVSLVSFPIWDLEGIACSEVENITPIMSLHTSYGLSERYNEEALARPLFRERIFAAMRNAESEALRKLPHLLANTRSIVTELSAQCGKNLAPHVHHAIHGVPSAPKSDKTRGLILFAGRFEPRKGVDLAVEAIEFVSRHHPDCHAVFVGGTSMPDDLKDRVRLLIEARRVSIEGVVSRSRLDELYSKAEIALLPSRYESFGLVAAEALANGCPVVSLACGGIAEVVESGFSGILVGEGEGAGERLGTAVLQLLSNEDEIARMRANAIEAATKDFSLYVMGSQLEQALINIAKTATPLTTGPHRAQ